MKLKVTIWCEDPDMRDLDQITKENISDVIKNEFHEVGLGVIDIQIEESSFED